MKAKLIVIILFLSTISILAQTIKSVSADSAKLIMKTHFVSVDEARFYFGDLPSSLNIGYSANTLTQYKDYWLLPILCGQTTSTYKYQLIKPVYPYELITSNYTNVVDTLEINEAKRSIYLLSKLRPDFLSNEIQDNEFSLFFRSKTYSEERDNYRQIFSFTPKRSKFLLVDWPDNIAYGNLTQTFVSFLTDKNGKLYLGIIPLPDTPIVSLGKDISILTLLYVR